MRGPRYAEALNRYLLLFSCPLLLHAGWAGGPKKFVLCRWGRAPVFVLVSRACVSRVITGAARRSRPYESRNETWKEKGSPSRSASLLRVRTRTSTGTGADARLPTISMVSLSLSLCSPGVPTLVPRPPLLRRGLGSGVRLCWLVREDWLEEALLFQVRLVLVPRWPSHFATSEALTSKSGTSGPLKDLLV